MNNTTLKLIGLLCALLMPVAQAAEINFLQATPVGSWRLQEDTVVDHKGRETVNSMRTSMLGEEKRDGVEYVWVEMSVEMFTVKKGKRKPSGDRMIMKSLIRRSAFTSDTANALFNMRGLADEMIIQTGDEQPMRMSGMGSFAQGMLAAMGTEVTFDFKAQGDEAVSTTAGSFDAKKYVGSGSTKMKVMFRSVEISSETTAWMSSKVPFGMVKSVGTTTQNGKVSTTNSELIKYGASGAKSEITQEPQDMPDMPNMKDLFGG